MSSSAHPESDRSNDSRDQNPYSAPSQSSETIPSPAVSAADGDATGGLIPYKNPFALAAYYCGIFALFPCIGLPLGIVSVGFGIKGLKDRKRNPIIKGSVHAWIGIGFGLFQFLYNVPFAAGIVYTLLRPA